jgi:hypothetical protein
MEREMCALTSFTTYAWHISHCKQNSVRYCHKCIKVFVSSSCYSCQILLKTLVFLSDFRKLLKYQISLKSVWWEPRCSLWTDMTSLKAAVRNFANCPKYDCVTQNPDSIVLYCTDLSNCYLYFPRLMFARHLTSCHLSVSVCPWVSSLKTKLNNYL